MNKTAVDFPLENLCFTRQKKVTQLAAATSVGTMERNPFCGTLLRSSSSRPLPRIAFHWWRLTLFLYQTRTASIMRLQKLGSQKNLALLEK
jgi:hypothetical protein